MKYRYAIPMLLTALLLSTKAFAYDDYDEDDFGIAEAFSVTLVGGGFLLAGYLLGNYKRLEDLSKGLLLFGMFIGGIGVLNIALMILSWAITTVFSFALYIGGLALAGYIFYSIYQWLFTKKA